MKIGVIGAGPIGGVLSALLTRAGHDVSIVEVAKDILSKARQIGLKVTGPMASKLGGEFIAKPVSAVSDFSEAGKPDLVFVCVKATALVAVAASLKKSWAPGTVIVSFQNGIDTEDLLGEFAGRDYALRVAVNFGCNAIEPCEYSINWVTPPNYLGALTPNGRRHSQRVAEILNGAGLSTKIVGDIKKYAFQKASLNATLCPICALTDLNMGEAMACPETRSLALKILLEAVAVGEKMGWKFDNSIDDDMKYLEGGGPHPPSMAVDIRSGRRTEIAFMNGKICEYGLKFGVPTPYNDAMTMAIRGKEAGLSHPR